MAYELKFHDEFTGESSDVDIDQHTPTDAGDNWSVMTGNTTDPYVDLGTTSLCQAYHSGAYYQGAFANISGGWNVTPETVKQKAEFLFTYYSTKMNALLYGQQTNGHPTGYTGYHSLNYWKIGRIDDGDSVPSNIALCGNDTSPTVGSDVMTLTCELDSQALSINGGEWSGTATDATYDYGQPAVATRKTVVENGIYYVKFWEDAGATPVTASGTPTLTAVTASGAVTTEIGAYGTPSITAITATGLVGHINEASGTPSLTAVTASGAVTTEIGAYGTATLTALTATGSVDTTQQILEASGTATATAMTADGYGYRTTVSITSVSEDDVYDDGSAGIVIVGTNFVN